MVFNDINSKKEKKRFYFEEKHLKFADASPLCSFFFDFRHLLEDEQAEQNYYLAGGEIYLV